MRYPVLIAIVGYDGHECEVMKMLLGRVVLARSFGIGKGDNTKVDLSRGFNASTNANDGKCAMMENVR